MIAKLLADLLTPNFPQGMALLRWNPGYKGHLALAVVVGPPDLRERDQAVIYGGTLVPDLSDPATEGVLKDLARKHPLVDDYAFCRFYRDAWVVNDIDGPVKVNGVRIKGGSEGEAWANLLLALNREENVQSEVVGEGASGDGG